MEEGAGDIKVKVIDFGFARLVWEEDGYEFRGTPGYVAPEYVADTDWPLC
jgi:serine/threonine protein kinase